MTLIGANFGLVFVVVASLVVTFPHFCGGFHRARFSIEEEEQQQYQQQQQQQLSQSRHTLEDHFGAEEDDSRRDEDGFPGNGEINAMVHCPLPCVCRGNSSSLPSQVSQVNCKGQNLTSIPPNLPLTTRVLHLDRNSLDHINPTGLARLESLVELTLSQNQLSHFPQELMQSDIQILNLAYNRIRRLSNHILRNYSKLHALILSHNLIEQVDEDAFVGAVNLNILELNDNRLTEVPPALGKLRNLQELNLGNNRIIQIHRPFHQLLPRLVMLEVKGNPIDSVHPDGFAHLRQLKRLIISDVKNLTDFPHLNGTTSLEILRIDRCSLTYIPHHLCHLSPKLKSLDLRSNRVGKLPKFEGCTELRILDVGLNEIEELEEGGFEPLSQLHDLHLSHNLIQWISAAAFRGLTRLRTLDLSYNNIENIHPEAFLPTPELEDLNLGNNYFPTIPSEGLAGIFHLKIANNPNLREFPGPKSFPQVRTLVLSFAYHCCQFTSYGLTKSSAAQPPIIDSVFYPTDKEFDSGLSNLNLSPDFWTGFANFSHNGGSSGGGDFWKTIGSTFSTDPALIDEDGFGEGNPRDLIPPLRDIQCIPLPGPFLPCNDLFDWWTLRCGVWVVFLLALMGNGTVVFVLICARTKMDVPRFLVCNLAIADFFMGVYLGFLAVVDAATLGEFRKFAIPWQLSRGCQMAGFLGVLSSELSVYTLAVITMERHYAITHAMHLNKRLSLRHASYIMIVGWVFAIVMATLPLFGVSDYRKFAVCLPFETGDGVSLSYVVFLMFANGVAFTILMGCYLKMYCSIRGSQAWNSNDTRIAKRMALLVFTDLLCWFPIAFFSLTAVFGLQLVSLEEAKVFTVFILPLNSCCNPFLYAILTKQFKKDCVLICKAIEESRVTRGIGRCRHSSNFSNRQTAANTGSLVEKSSKDGQPCICHSGLHPVGGDENGNAKYGFLPSADKRNRLGPFGKFFSRYILCQSGSKEASRKARDDYRMRNVRRFLYNTTPGNYPAEAQKHHRHPSVSSDNFSSSRSDSWRVQGRCGIPLRLLEPRRRNSWAVTRKPSQDSNLSSSRNDSSAMSNSTATWRLSRSSVSSDAASHSGGGKSSLKRTIAATAAATHTAGACARAIVTSPNTPSTPATASASKGAISGGKGKVLSFHENVGPASSSSAASSQLPAPSAIGSSVHDREEDTMLLELGNPRRDSVKASQHRKQTVRIQAVGTVAVAPGAPSTNDIDDDPVIEDDELSAKIATNRPRLVRQSAFFSDELVIEPEVCPVHGSLIPGTYDNEEEDQVSDIDEGDEEDFENGVDAASPILKKAAANPYSIAFVIVPQRLSTIASRDSAASQIMEEDDNSVLKWSGLGPAAAAMIVSSPAAASPGPAPAVTPGGRRDSRDGAAGGPLLISQHMVDLNRRKLSDQARKNVTLPPAPVFSAGSSQKRHSFSSLELAQGEALQHTSYPIPPNEGHPEEDRGDSGGAPTGCPTGERRVFFQLPGTSSSISSNVGVPGVGGKSKNEDPPVPPPDRP